MSKTMYCGECDKFAYEDADGYGICTKNNAECRCSDECHVKLFPHNQKAYEAVMNAFAVQDRAAVVHATGTGKSYIGAAVAEHFSNVLIIAPVAFILNEHRKVHKNNVTFATYAKLLLNYEEIGIGFDLIILDEFHRAGAEGWGAAVNVIKSIKVIKIYSTF